MLKNKRHKATQLKGLLVYWFIGKDSYAVLSNVVTSLEGL